MGADMVCAGRSLMPLYMTDGAEGVARQLTTMTDELKSMMFRTGSPDVKHIDPSVIHEAWWL